MILNPNPRQTDSAKTRARTICMHIWIVTDAAQDDVRKYRHGSLLLTQKFCKLLGEKTSRRAADGCRRTCRGPRTTHNFSFPVFLLSTVQTQGGCRVSASTKNRGATSPVCNKWRHWALRLKTKPRGLAWFVSFQISSNIFWPVPA